MIAHWADLATQLYHDRTRHSPAHRRHLFVTSVDTVFQVIRARVAEKHPVLVFVEDEPSLMNLLACTVHVLRWSLLYRKYNCGSYTPLQWIKSISGCYKAAEALNTDPWITVPMTDEETMWPIFRLILVLLKACMDQALLTKGGHDDTIDETNSDDFEHLMDLLGRPQLPELRHELSEPPTGLMRTWAGLEDGVSAAIGLWLSSTDGTSCLAS